MKRDKEVKVRANEAEMEQLKQRASDAGYSLAEYLRLLGLGMITPEGHAATKAS